VKERKKRKKEKASLKDINRKLQKLSKKCEEKKKSFDIMLPRKSCKKKASRRGEREKRSVFEGKWRRKQKG